MLGSTGDFAEVLEYWEVLEIAKKYWSVGGTGTFTEVLEIAKKYWCVGKYWRLIKNNGVL